MEEIDKYTNQISNFIYEQPDLVAVLLEKNNYPIETQDKSLSEILQQINAGVFTLLHDGNKEFADELSSLMFNEGYLNFYADAIAFVGNFGSALITAFSGKSIAKKQRALQESIAVANRASEEKLANAKLATTSETERVKMISDSITQYRISQQQQGTLKIMNTWTYVVGFGAIIGIVYGLILLTKRKKK